MKPRTTIASLSREITTEADAYAYLETMRWGDTPLCGHCGGSDDVYLIPPTNGISRATAAGTMSERRVWKCRSCAKQFSVLTGTIMHATKVSVRTWVMVMFEMCSSKNGVSAREIERKYGVTCRTAWHMLHRLRRAMEGGDRLMSTMRGTIAADETWIGGLVGNKPKHVRHANRPAGMPWTDKIPVLSLIDVVTGEARSAVVPDVTGQTLHKVIGQQVDIAGSTLWTDEGNWYHQLGREFIAHQTVNHSKDEYVGSKRQTTNAVEGFFSQLKRSIDGTHHHVSAKHLHRYVSEHDFRYSTCKMSDGGRMRTLAKQMEGRLSYKRVKANS